MATKFRLIHKQDRVFRQHHFHLVNLNDESVLKHVIIITEAEFMLMSNTHLRESYVKRLFMDIVTIYAYYETRKGFVTGV